MTAAVAVVAACGDDSSLDRARLGQGCALNTDCNEPLVCIFAACHTECRTSRDCERGSRCVPTPSGKNVCQLPEESRCDETDPCPEGQACHTDRSCRATCSVDANCAGEQRCERGACLEWNESSAPPRLGEAGPGPSGGGDPAGGSDGGGATGSGSSDANSQNPEAGAVDAAAVDGYRVGGTFIGAGAGGGAVAVSLNGAETLSLTADGPFSFASALANAAPYAVTVSAPNGQDCSVTGGSGQISGADVRSVSIRCVYRSYSVSVLASGLVTRPGALDVVLLANDHLTFVGAENVIKTFSQRVPANVDYRVTIGGQPDGQHCEVASDRDPGQASPLGLGLRDATVHVRCADRTIGGSVSGLPQGASVGLRLDLPGGPEFLSVSTNGAFRFPNPVLLGSAYAVVVATQPAGAACLVTRGSGAALGASVESVQVECN